MYKALLWNPVLRITLGALKSPRQLLFSPFLSVCLWASSHLLPLIQLPLFARDLKSYVLHRILGQDRMDPAPTENLSSPRLSVSQLKRCRRQSDWFQVGQMSAPGSTTDGWASVMQLSLRDRRQGKVLEEGNVAGRKWLVETSPVPTPMLLWDFCPPSLSSHGWWSDCLWSSMPLIISKWIPSLAYGRIDTRSRILWEQTVFLFIEEVLIWCILMDARKREKAWAADGGGISNASCLGHRGLFCVATHHRQTNTVDGEGRYGRCVAVHILVFCLPLIRRYRREVES